jgi:hypothetical protein
MCQQWVRPFALFAALTSTACGRSELPEGKEDYAGGWGGATIGLVITENASVDYVRGGTSISGSIVRFEDDDFVVYAVMNFLFDVTKPPHDVDGEQHMTVNGEDLIRSF